ncbi:MAG: sugar phosphate nucleotidyltransferase [Candidatus Gracilibacteria bacterium]|nr:sugar phosphate nucleotidyltransferase [Candidatus Gracilibacteria bacterium]
MKCIIPIAGLGTRLLPFSKVIPKSMLPVHDKPCVQWIVEELEAAGIRDIIFVYSKGQELVEEYFSEHSWYDDELLKRGKHKEAEYLKKIRNLATFHFVRQEEQKGDGHAILQAKELFDDEESFLVIFGDCLYTGENAIERIIQLNKKVERTIVAVQEINPNDVSHYGIIEPHEEIDDFIINTFVEKPTPEEAPSNLAIIGRYLLTKNIWKYLEKENSGSGEIRLIDALNLMHKDEEIHGTKLNGTWLDTGTLEGLQRAGNMLKKL